MKHLLPLFAFLLAYVCGTYSADLAPWARVLLALCALAGHASLWLYALVLWEPSWADFEVMEGDD